MNFVTAINTYRLQLLGILALFAVTYAPIVPKMVGDWSTDENYSHGFIIPVIAGYFIWRNWAELKELEVKPWLPGLFVLVAGLVQLLLGWLAIEYFTMRTSMVLVLAGLVLFFFGKRIFRALSLPIGYLLFMVPLPYIIYDAMAFPLKLFVTKVSVGFLKLIGVVVLREGNIIMFPTTTLEVADACSGIRSLVSLLALAVAYAFFLELNNWQRLVVIVSAIPIAIATNASRVIVTGILAQWWGAKAAEGFFHEFAGLAVFALAMVLLVAVGGLFRRRDGA